MDDGRDTRDDRRGTMEDGGGTIFILSFQIPLYVISNEVRNLILKIPHIH